MMQKRKERKARESKKRECTKENERRGKAHQRRNMSTARRTENRKIRRPVLYWKPEGIGVFVLF
jgi:hypothetical protein